MAIVQHEVGEGIPDGITRQDLLEACQTFDEGVEHAFGPSAHYDVISAGKRYPPKAIVTKPDPPNFSDTPILRNPRVQAV